MEATLLKERRSWPQDRRISLWRSWWRRIWDKVSEILFYLKDNWPLYVANDLECKNKLIFINTSVKEKIDRIILIKPNVWLLLNHYFTHILQYIYYWEYYINKWFLDLNGLSNIIIRYTTYVKYILDSNEESIVKIIGEAQIGLNIQSEDWMKKIEEALWIEKYSEAFLN